MKIDLSGVHYGQLKESEKKYDAARLKNDIEGAKKYAQICANFEKLLAEDVPDQAKAHLEKAKKWEVIVRTAGTAPEKNGC